MSKKSLSARLEEASQVVPTAPTTGPEVPQAVVTPTVVSGVSESPLVKARKARRPVPANESKTEKLARLANSRVTRACSAISVIGNLAAYKPTPGEVEKIMLALGESCASVANRLNGVRRESITFTLR